MLYTNNHKERMDNAIESLSTQQKWELLDKLESQNYDFMNYENENDYGTTAIEVLVNAILEVTSFIAKKLGIVGK
jgi:hypothetical protein